MREYNVKITFNDGGIATPASPIVAESEEQACNEFINQVTALKEENRYIKEVHVEDPKELSIPLDKDKAIEKPVFINVENLMEHIVTNKLEVNEILSYLSGYVEGSRF